MMVMMMIQFLFSWVFHLYDDGVAIPQVGSKAQTKWNLLHNDVWRGLFKVSYWCLITFLFSWIFFFLFKAVEAWGLASDMLKVQTIENLIMFAGDVVWSHWNVSFGRLRISCGPHVESPKLTHYQILNRTKRLNCFYYWARPFHSTSITTTHDSLLNNANWQKLELCLGP